MLQSMRAHMRWLFPIIAVVFIVFFVYMDTSGITSMPVTRGTAVGTVNGETITYDQWYSTYQSMVNEEQRRRGQPLTQDELQRIEDAAFERIVEERLLAQEYRRRGITVTDDEVRQAALYSPLPEFLEDASLQTEGRFDREKYERFLRSPSGRPYLPYIESRYRSEIPRQKLFWQVASDVYITDSRLWRMWQDEHDSAQVSFVALRPEMIADSAVAVGDAELRRYFNERRATFPDRPGRAVVSLVMLPRVITAADTAAVRNRAEALRNEILAGANFEDIARRESADTVSGAQGGSLGRTGRGAFVEPFERAAYALRPGEVSEPVLTPFGYHLIRLDERKGDTIAARHILLHIQQSDSSAVRTDRRADTLATLAGSSDQPARFDSAAKRLQLPVGTAVAFEGEPLTWNGRYVPNVSAWAFGGARVGETSELFDSDDAYFLARLDSLVPGGKPTFEMVREEIRQLLVRERKVEMLAPRAKALADAVTAGRTLEQAAEAQGLAVEKSPLFNRVSPVPGIGQLNEAIGAAFSLPVGAVSEPVKTRTGVFVLRVDRRVKADRAAWEAQRQQQRERLTQALQQQRVQQFVASLREEAEIEDRRKEIRRLTREAAA